MGSGAPPWIYPKYVLAGEFHDAKSKSKNVRYLSRTWSDGSFRVRTLFTAICAPRAPASVRAKFDEVLTFTEGRLKVLENPLTMYKTYKVQKQARLDLGNSPARRPVVNR
jgi:hypothetical protein